MGLLVGIGLDTLRDRKRMFEMIGRAIQIPNNRPKRKMKRRHGQRGFTNAAKIVHFDIGATQNRGGSNFENEIEIEVGKLHE